MSFTAYSIVAFLQSTYTLLVSTVLDMQPFVAGKIIIAIGINAIIELIRVDLFIFFNIKLLHFISLII